MDVGVERVLAQLDPESRRALSVALLTKQAFFWIGSGFSANFGYPSWDEVLDGVKARLGFAGSLGENPLRAAELLHARHRQKDVEDGVDRPGELFNKLVAEVLLELRKSVGNPPWTHKFIELRPSTIVTTNWDNVLESIFDGIPNVIVRGEKCPQVSINNVNIFKIHGDCERPESIVVTQSQYNHFQREETYLNRKIYTLFTEQSAIFLGYSLSDPNIAFLYDEALSDVGTEKSPAFMVVRPGKDDSSKVELARLLFSQKNIKIIEADIEEFFNACHHLLAEAQNGIDAFKHEFSGLYKFLETLVVDVKNKKLDKGQLTSKITSEMTGNMAFKAITTFFQRPEVYSGLGGSVMSPSNTIDNQEAHLLIQAAITIGNNLINSGHNIYKQNRDFYEAALSHCISNPHKWDFHLAKRPFIDLLCIIPNPDWEIYDKKIKHMKEMLDWAAPKFTYMKCWAIWEALTQYKNFIGEDEIVALLNLVEKEKNDGGDISDSTRWIKYLLEHRDNLKGETKDMMNILLAAT